MKKNLFYASIASVVIIAISFGLLALPGQFYNLILEKTNPQPVMSGYEFIFNALPETFKSYTGVYEVGASGLGIAALVMMVLALPCFILVRKSSALPLFGAILIFIAGLFFLLMKPWGADPMFKAYIKSGAVLWVSYVIGALLVLAAIAIVYFTIKVLKEEKVAPKSNVGYSYLKK